MYEEKRPTCVTVIGWVWIILGVLSCFVSCGGFLNLTLMKHFAQTQPAAHPIPPVIFILFPVVFAINGIVGVLALVSGINFLKLKAWARRVLEILTWVSLLYTLGFGIFWMISLFFMTRGASPGGIEFMMQGMGVVIIGVYAVPLIIMLKYLRGDKVRQAMNPTMKSPAADARRTQ